MMVAVTGAAGFLGGAVIREAISESIRVRALARVTGSSPKVLNENVEWIFGDVRDPQVLPRLLIGCDAVIHLASAGVQQLDDLRFAVERDLPALMSLLAASIKMGIRRVILAGSCMEYGKTGSEIGERGLRECDPLMPINAYAIAKVAGFDIARNFAELFGVELVVLRPFHLYGLGESISRLVPSVI